MNERQIRKSQEDTEKVGRGPHIPDEWKKHIMHQALTEVNTPRMLLADEILEQMRQSGGARGDKLPDRESIAKLISRARNHDDPQDKPWSMATIDQYPIPPEALPAVLRVWKSRLEKDTGFIIREAKWVSRLSALQQEQDIEKLSFTANRYALVEKVSELQKDTGSTLSLDLLLVGLLEVGRDEYPFAHYLVYGDSAVLQILQIGGTP